MSDRIHLCERHMRSDTEHGWARDARPCNGKHAPIPCGAVYTHDAGTVRVTVTCLADATHVVTTTEWEEHDG